MLPDVAAIDREFDYLVPPSWMTDGRFERMQIGSMVRIPLQGRNVAGWITAIDVEPSVAGQLSPLAKLSGCGPGADLVEMSKWAAWRWAGRRVAFLRAASPPRMVAGRPTAVATGRLPAGPADVFDEAFSAGNAVVRIPPTHDLTPVAMAACRKGQALIVTPDQHAARLLAIALRRAGVTVALAPDDWSAAAGGATIVGPRSAAWMPAPNLAAVLVIDEHDELLKNERTPTWHAREVVMERARLRGVPAVVASSVPTLEALRSGKLFRPSRDAERDGWPVVEVVDRRDEAPTRGGLFAEGVIDRIRRGGRVVCVLNRKGRARLLACASCGEIVRTDDGRSPMVLMESSLQSVDGKETRPAVCSVCGSTSLKYLRLGVTRAREELSAAIREEVEEVTAESSGSTSSRVVIGTEAVLHRTESADLVVFLDFDQELLATRQRASEQAIALLARAARLVGPRSQGGALLVQTRLPDHVVIKAAVAADPSILARWERDQRQAMGMPPYGAEVLVSGAGAVEFIEGIRGADGVKIRGPLDDRWMLRSVSHEPLLDVLAKAARPSARLRIEVDPLRA